MTHKLNRFKQILVPGAIAATLAFTLPGVAIIPGVQQQPDAASVAEHGSQSVWVAQRSRTQRIRFQPGADSATVTTAVIRGTRDIYLLGAGQGQMMTIRIESLENNAVFDVEAPPSQKGSRRVLTEAASTWSGKLPASGDYQIVVGSTRGNASYKLFVKIR